VGAALDSNTFHPGRSAAQHLRIIATVTGLPRRRVDEVLGLTGLADVAGRRVGGFSLGMRQRRLSLAGALLRIRACWSSTSRSTGSTRTVSAGSAACRVN
jgi:ABC-2 type transport system ATP-binding protein